MADNKEYVTHSDERGSVNISENVICVIAAAAVAEIEGVAGFVSQGKELADMLGIDFLAGTTILTWFSLIFF